MKKYTMFVMSLMVWCSVLLGEEGPKRSPWVLVKDKKGVKVYTRKAEGIAFKEFKGTMTMKTSLASLIALVRDAEASPDWMENCTVSKVLEHVNDCETYTYSLSKAPWPVADRDVIIHNLISRDSETGAVVITQTGKPDYLQEKEGVTRVKRLEGFWKFTPQEGGTVDVVYQVLSDPAGEIPVWLVNSSIVSQPYETLLKMQKVVQREKYQQAELDMIPK